MGQLYDIIQRHMDSSPYRPYSQREVAEKLGVSPTTLGNWRKPKGFIDKEHLKAVARLTGVPYERVRDAMLDDIGLLHEEDDTPKNTPNIKRA